MPAAGWRGCKVVVLVGAALLFPSQYHGVLAVTGHKAAGRALVLRIEPRYASLAPDGLPSFPRSARLTPPARLPASGLRASLACGLHIEGAVAIFSRLP